MEEQRNYTVYMHTCPNNKKYIGATCQIPEGRWGKNGYGYRTQENFYADIQIFGWENIKHEILKENLTLEEAQYWERYYIKNFNTQNPEFGYNLTEGGEKPPMLGKHMPEEHKKKQSERMKGENNPMYGKKQSEEVKEKIRQGNLGKKRSEESKRKQGESVKGENNPFYGKHHKEESIKKISKSLKGKNKGKPSPMKGKQRSEESKKKQSESIKGRKWWNNGEEEIPAFDCPKGFVAGRLKRKNKNILTNTI